MNLRSYLSLSVVALLLFNAGCQQNPTEPTSTKTSTISGIVVDKGSSKPIPLALVYDRGSLAKVDTSKSDGSYKLSMDLSSNYNTSVYAKASGYASDTTAVSLKPGDNISGINIHMVVVDSSAVVTGSSGPPASIVLKSPTPGSIALKGTGINETAVLTFIVKDSLGNPVVGANNCIVNFRLVARPDTLTFLSPTSAKSNRLTGEVSTTVSAGTTPGVLQVIASTRGDTVKASPVFLSAGGGLPDSAGVSMGANPINIAGRLYGNMRSTITMFVNDRWGNPVANGTKVSFVTSAGSIVSSTTSQDGMASVTLISTLNFPVNPLVTITATTNGDKYYRPSDSSIVRQMQILFSGPTAPIALDTSTTNRFDIPDGGTKFFRFTVSDDRGFPLVAGSTVTVTIDGADTLTKNLAVLGPPFAFADVQSPGWTHFTVGVVDKLLGGASGSIVIGIHVTSTNGNADCWFGGRILPSGAISGPTFNGPASIAGVDTISKRMSFIETQKPDTIAKLTFIVKDAYNSPLQSSNKAQVQFFLSGAPAGVHFYPSMTTQPVSDSTDAKGMVSVLVSSGNTPGTFSIQARTTNGVNIYDTYTVPIIVRHGLPDSNFISSEIKKNIFNPKRSVKLTTFTLDLEDYTSDIPAPTSVLFTTTGGSIGAMAISDSNSGKAVVNLYGGNETNDPVLGPGWGYIKSTMPVHGGLTITKFFPFLFTYNPIIAVTSAAVMNSTLDTLASALGDGQSVNVDFTVLDKNNNPISSANSITITSSLAGITLSGDINLTSLKDTQLPSDAVHHFSIQNKTGGALGTFSVTITVSGESGTVTKTIFGVLSAQATVTSGYASSIQLLSGSPSTSTISVQGTGATETSSMSFVVKDSSGNPVNSSHQATVTFSIVGGPGGGEFVSPPSIVTDANGKVTTTINSGTKPGVVQVIATTTVGGKTITSAPVTVTITGGLPDKNHLTIWTDKLNYPSLKAQGGALGKVLVQVGDVFGDPVQPSAMFFRSSGGGVSPASITTDATGSGQVSILGGNPLPIGGLDTITVSTNGVGGSVVSAKTVAVISGSPLITGTPSDLGVIGAGSSLLVNFKVADANGNPLASGSTITVTAGGAVGSQTQLSGNTSVTTGDIKDTSTAWYQFAVLNNTPSGGSGGTFNVTITVSGPNGSAIKTLNGTLTATIGIITRVKSLQFVSSSNSPIYIQNTGLQDLTTLTFALIDSIQHPVTLMKADTVLFSILGGTGQELLSTTAMLSNALGQVSTVFSSGTKSGTFTVLAQVKNLPTIQATYDVTVIGGYPDPNKFTMQWSVTPPDSLLNLPGLVLNSVLANVNILALDKYSNPAKPSVIQFDQTSGGSVVSVTTDANGRASASLSGGKPIPNEPSIGTEYGLVGPNRGFGFGFLKARTLGENGVFVRDSVMFLFTGAPIVTTSVDTVILDDGGTQNFSYFISDVYGKMIATLPSTQLTITVTVNGPAASSLSIESDLPPKLPSNPVFPTTYHLKISDNTPNGGLSGNFTITVGVDGPLGHKEKVVNGILHGSSSGSNPTQLVVTSVSSNIVATRGSGGLNTSDVTVQALDVSGRPIDMTRSDTVFFSISDTSGGSKIIPSYALTDANGQASTRFYGGIKYGSPTVTGKMKSFSSPPQTIRISGPSITNFNATVSATNMPGLSKIGSVVGAINVQLGDSLGNPVVAGTQMNFSTSGGMVDPSAATGAGGSASVNLYGGAAPIDPTIGWGNVTVQTQGNNSTTLQKKIPFLFSGQPVITTLNVPASDSVLILTKSSVNIDYKIADINRNPLAANNNVLINISGAASPDIREIGYYNFATDGTTDTNATVFRVTLSDLQAPGEGGGNFDATISVVGPNGSASRIIHGYLQAPGTIGGSTTDSISSIVCTSNSVDISVQGTGKPETATLIFIGKDKSGQAVDLAHGSLVSFAISPPTLGASLTITSVRTDGSGQAITLVRAGTIAGAIQVVASAVVNGVTIRSLPVNISINSGLPDQRHFTLGAQFYNFPGLDYNGTKVPITLFMADKYSNPVSLGTTAYFYSTHGKIATVGSTSDNIGDITQNLYSQNPRPDPFEIDGGTLISDTVSYGPQNKYNVQLDRGWARVYAQSYNDAGGMVEDSIYILWTGSPIITNTGATTGSVGYASSIGGFSFTVADRFGHPMSAGTKITVAAGDLKVTTDAPSDGMADVTPGGPGAGWPQSVWTSFSITLAGSGTAPTALSTYNVVVTVAHPLYGSFSAVIATITELLTP